MPKFTLRLIDEANDSELWAEIKTEVLPDVITIPLNGCYSLYLSDVRPERNIKRYFKIRPYTLASDEITSPKRLL